MRRTRARNYIDAYAANLEETIACLPFNNTSNELWLIIEWNQGHRKDILTIINKDTLTKPYPLEELRNGKEVDAMDKGRKRRARIILASPNIFFLQREIEHLQRGYNEIMSINQSLDNISNSSNVIIDLTEEIENLESNENLNSSNNSDDQKPNKIEPTEKIENKGTNDVLKVQNFSMDNNQKKMVNHTPLDVEENENDESKGTDSIVEKGMICSTPINIGTTPRTSFMASKILPLKKRNYNMLIIEGMAIPNDNVKAEAPSKNQPQTTSSGTQTVEIENDPEDILSIKNQSDYLKKEGATYYQQLLSLQARLKTIQKYVLSDKVQDCSETAPANSETISKVKNNTNDQKTTPEGSNNGSIWERSNDTPTRSNSPIAHCSSNPSGSSSQNTPSVSPEDMTLCSDMVAIGPGKTLIGRHTYNQIMRVSYSVATRKLLMDIFPRKVLATHSLTGKSSPAFSNKAPKLKLDERKVADIVSTVANLCNTTESLVRNTITTKCSDENKMYRQRMSKKALREEQNESFEMSDETEPNY